MNSILFVNACVRPNSRTKELADFVLSRLDGSVKEVTLTNEVIEPLNWETLQLRDSAIKAKDYSGTLFRYARDFAEADCIVVAAPYWDLAFPATLKQYFEAVTVTGLTYRYTPEGVPEGLCRAKRLIYVTTAGGSVYPFNFGFDYVKALAQGFYGIKDVLFCKAEKLDIWGSDPEAILQQAKEEAAALLPR